MKKISNLYSDYLLASFSQTSATGLSNLMNGEISHDQVTRFLSEEKKTSKDLWQVVKPFIKQSFNGFSRFNFANELMKRLSDRII